MTEQYFYDIFVYFLYTLVTKHLVLCGLSLYVENHVMSSHGGMGNSRTPIECTLTLTVGVETEGQEPVAHPCNILG